MYTHQQTNEIRAMHEPVNHTPQLNRYSDKEMLALVIGETAAEQFFRRYGSLQALMEKPAADFTAIDGIGATVASRMKAAAEIGRRLALPGTLPDKRITSPGDLANLLMPEMRYLTQEELRIVVVNTRNLILGVNTVYRGTGNCSQVVIADLFKHVLRYDKGQAFFLVHNHPSGDPSPSAEDIRITREIVRAGKLMDLQLLDHMVIGDGRYVSLKERGRGWD